MRGTPPRRIKPLALLRSALRIVIFLIALAAMLVLVAVPTTVILSLLSTPVEGEMQFRLRSPADTYYGLYLQLHRAELDAPASNSPEEVAFTVEPGESPQSIAERLESLGLVSSAKLFYAYVRYHGLGQSLEAGDYTLRRDMTIPEVVAALQHGSVKEVEITIPEGWRMEQVAEFLEQKGVMSADAFLAAARSGVWDERYDFLKDKPDDASLEGYLFPDTYRLPVPASPEDLIGRMLDNFGRKVTPQMRQRAVEMGFTLHEVVILASIVEREAVIPEERPIIASVYLNRLKKGMYLQADPTVQYAKGYDPVTKRWWAPMTIEEMSSVQSPYNTFLNPGLPPGPICSPGLDSIKAVLYPADTDYLFFFSRGDGTHVFAKTYEEHLKNQEKFGY